MPFEKTEDGIIVHVNEISRDEIKKAAKLLTEANELLGGMPIGLYDLENLHNLYSMIERASATGKGMFLVFYNNDLKMKLWKDSLPEGGSNPELDDYEDDGEGVMIRELDNTEDFLKWWLPLMEATAECSCPRCKLYKKEIEEIVSTEETE